MSKQIYLELGQFFGERRAFWVSPTGNLLFGEQQGKQGQASRLSSLC